MFSPSLRQIPITGFEWSFLLNERGIPEDGEIYENQEQEMSDITRRDEADEELAKSNQEAMKMKQWITDNQMLPSQRADNEVIQKVKQVNNSDLLEQSALMAG